MASRLDQALDEVIRDRSDNKRSGSYGRSTRRDTGSGGGGIRKRIGSSSSSPAIRSFVRTVNVMEERRGGGARNVDGQWSHDMFDDEDVPRSSILSRLGTARGGAQGGRPERGVELCVENLHYNVTEQDVKELFNTVADVTKARLIFDPSGRSTGLAYISYQSLADAEKAIQKYNNIELDGQPMQIKISERAASRPRSSGGSRFNNDRLSNRLGGRLGSSSSSSSSRRHNDRNDRDDHRPKRATRPTRPARGSDKREDRQKKVPTAEDLDREMESYMKSNSSDNNTGNSNINNNSSSSTAALEEDIEMMLE
ncbi:hypothetical protein MBANPS3_007860 [Mucor bainieri]